VFDVWAEIDLQKATGETSYCKAADIVVFETTDLSLASGFLFYVLTPSLPQPIKFPG